jgi:hypothetical protein
MVSGMQPVRIRHVRRKAIGFIEAFDTCGQTGSGPTG